MGCAFSLSLSDPFQCAHVSAGKLKQNQNQIERRPLATGTSVGISLGDDGYRSKRAKGIVSGARKA